MPYNIYGRSLKSVKSEIVLNPDNQLSLQPGGSVKGHLVISNESKLSCYGIVVAIIGVATVEFKVGGGSGHTQKNEAVVFQAHSFVCGHGNIVFVQNINLPPARHQFPFTLSLSSNAPASFKSTYAKINYELGAFLRAEDRYVQILSKSINIREHLNINSHPMFMVPLQLQIIEKSFSFSPGKRTSPKFKFLLELTRSGFISGEELPFNLKIINPSGLHFQNISVSLIRKTVYNAGSVTKATSVLISSANISKMESANEMNWMDKLCLPQDLIPSFKASPLYSILHSDIVTLLYSLKVVVKPSGRGTTLKGEVPITIGTVNTRTRSSHSDGSSGISQISSGALLSGPSNEDYNDTWSLMTQSTLGDRSLLPAYSQLSLHSSLRRRASISSIETLPPTYEEAIQTIPVHENRAFPEPSNKKGIQENFL